jgi:hypothetical protein
MLEIIVPRNAEDVVAGEHRNCIANLRGPIAIVAVKVQALLSSAFAESALPSLQPLSLPSVGVPQPNT